MSTRSVAEWQELARSSILPLPSPASLTAPYEQQRQELMVANSPETISAIIAAHQSVTTMHMAMAAEMTTLTTALTHLTELTAQARNIHSMLASTHVHSQEMLVALKGAQSVVQRLEVQSMFVVSSIQSMQKHLHVHTRSDHYAVYKQWAIVAATAAPNFTARCDARCSIGKGFANSKLYQQKCCGNYICGDCLHMHNFEMSAWGTQLHAQCGSCGAWRAIYKN